jgi:hypothetical protein
MQIVDALAEVGSSPYRNAGDARAGVARYQAYVLT